MFVAIVIVCVLFVLMFLSLNQWGFLARCYAISSDGVWIIDEVWRDIMRWMRQRLECGMWIHYVESWQVEFLRWSCFYENMVYVMIVSCGYLFSIDNLIFTMICLSSDIFFIEYRDDPVL